MKPSLPDGYTVTYEHHRELTNPQRMDEDPQLSQKGGATRAIIWDETGKAVAEGLALVHPNDNYSKKVGRDVSRGMALKALAGQPRQRRSAAALEHETRARKARWTKLPDHERSETRSSS